MTVKRGCRPICLRPGGRYNSYSCRFGAPRPTRSRMTMTGSRFPGSRVVASDHLPRDVSVSSGIYGRRLSAYSCGGSRGLVRQRQTYRIPLASPFGHYQSHTWHRIFIASTVESNLRRSDRQPAFHCLFPDDHLQNAHGFNELRPTSQQCCDHWRQEPNLDKTGNGC
jgi:hypothetical protein